MDVEIDDDSTSKKLKEAMDLGNSTSLAGSTSVSLNSDNINGSHSDVSYHGDDNVDDNASDEEIEGYDDCSDYYDNDDYMFDNDNSDDDYLKMQAQFDNVDLPPGVEASVSWLKNRSPKDVSYTSAQSDPANFSTGASSSSAGAKSHSDGKEDEKEVDVVRNLGLIKQFDTVDDFSDHHYVNAGFSGQEPQRAWTKKIQEEWKILEKDLPDTIYVRVAETRMDLMRAVLVGPAGTPYHDGLFVFDILFPPAYPNIPPMVYYYSGGLRLNPNLYDCGKVCLSLLNTWTGKGNEKWVPNTSTMLQVLVSIQALILNAKPFFNEPGYERYVGVEGDKKSKAYNEEVFILSLKTMIYTLRRPPKHFEDLVTGHFRWRAHDILMACKAYMDGAPIGSVMNGKIQDGVKIDKHGSETFKAAVAKMMRGLVSSFSKNGSENCEQFLQN